MKVRVHCKLQLSHQRDLQTRAFDGTHRTCQMDRAIVYCILTLSKTAQRLPRRSAKPSCILRQWNFGTVFIIFKKTLIPKMPRTIIPWTKLDQFFTIQGKILIDSRLFKISRFQPKKRMSSNVEYLQRSIPLVLLVRMIFHRFAVQEFPVRFREQLPANPSRHSSFKIHVINYGN